MKTYETAISFRRQLAELVESEIPELVWSGRGSRSTTDLNPMCFCERDSATNFLDGLKELLGVSKMSKLQIRSKSRGGGWHALFSSLGEDEWEDVVIEVLDGPYLERAQRVGERFEALTGKEATVYKRY